MSTVILRHAPQAFPTLSVTPLSGTSQSARAGATTAINATLAARETRRVEASQIPPPKLP